MPTTLHLLEVNLAALALVSTGIVRLLQIGRKQGRAKRALENSLVSAQAPIAVTPFVSSRSLIAQAENTEGLSTQPPVTDPVVLGESKDACTFARHPAWSDVEAVAETPQWAEPQMPPATAVSAEAVLAEFPAELLLLPNEIYFEGDAPVVVEEDQATPDLPREHVGILFLEDECDLAALKLAEVTQIAPRPQLREAASVATSLGEAAPVEFIDGLCADPIDGMPFTPGEQVTPCACGTAYRLETAVWLHEQANGECVQCHRKLTDEIRRIAEVNRPEQWAASA